MKHYIKNQIGAVTVEVAMSIGIFLFVFFSFIELARALYILNTIQIAAQSTANKISINETGYNGYTVSNFTQYANEVRFPGSVIDSTQFAFDVVNSSNTSTVTSGVGDSATSTKVIVTVSFPPSASPSYKVPIFDPGRLIGHPIFGTNGLPLTARATCFLERSRRPIIN